VQAAESKKPALTVVDYVQLLRDKEGDGRMRERNVSAAARGLKEVARELGISMLALVQLNRDRATRSDNDRSSPTRESGDLESTVDSDAALVDRLARQEPGRSVCHAIFSK
jgi:replicative DNA helicase